MATVAQKIKLIADWAPALPLLSEISTAKTAPVRVSAVLKLLRFAATKTAMPQDDEILRHIEAVLLSKEGQELMNYVVALVTAVSFTEVDE